VNWVVLKAPLKPSRLYSIARCVFVYVRVLNIYCEACCDVYSILIILGVIVGAILQWVEFFFASSWRVYRHSLVLDIKGIGWSFFYSCQDIRAPWLVKYLSASTAQAYSLAVVAQKFQRGGARLDLCVGG